MSTPNNRRAYADVLGTNVPQLEGDLLRREWGRQNEPNNYRLRLLARVAGGASDPGVSVLFRFLIDDGFGDGERARDLTVVTGASDETQYELSDGIGLYLTVRVLIIPATPLAALPRNVLATAAVAPLLSVWTPEG